MRTDVPISIVRKDIRDNDCDMAFRFKCTDHHLENSRYILSSNECSYLDDREVNGRHICYYFSPMECGNKQARDEILRCVSKSNSALKCTK
jgi:hypothetical protein